MKDLAAITVNIDSIKQDPKNARLHSTQQLEYIAASLERFGQQKPIVVNEDNIIIAGNGTHLAAKDILGWKTISIVVSNLTPEESRAYGIADNQLATQSDWDLDSLSKHIQDLAEWNPLQDWKSIGFEKEAIEPIVEASEEEAPNALQDFLNGDKGSEERPEMGKPIKLTFEQREVIDQAVNIIRLQEQDYKMSEGRALELLAADFIAGAMQESDAEETQDTLEAPF